MPNINSSNVEVTDTKVEATADKITVEQQVKTIHNREDLITLKAALEEDISLMQAKVAEIDVLLNT